MTILEVVVPKKGFKRIFSHKGWTISAQKGPSLASEEANQEKQKLGLPVLPEMVFGDNFLTLENPSHNFCVSINGLDCLSCWDPSFLPPVTAQNPEKWLSSNPTVTKSQMESIDWTFSSMYCGTLTRTKPEGKEDSSDNVIVCQGLSRPNQEQKKNVHIMYSSNSKKPDQHNKDCSISFKEVTEEINKELLSQTDQEILFYEELHFLEDDLGENGESKEFVKMRVTDSYWFVLMRSVVRVDGVLFRSVETRLTHIFDQHQTPNGDLVIHRQFQIRESPFADIAAELGNEPSSLSNSHMFLPLLKVKMSMNEHIIVHAKTQST